MLRHVKPDYSILLVKLITQIGDCIKKVHSTRYTSGDGDFMQSLCLLL